MGMSWNPSSWSIKNIIETATDASLTIVTGGLYSDWGKDIAEAAWKWVKHQLIPDMRRDREAQVQSSTNARNIIYGRTRVGCQIAYAETTGDKSQTLHLICIHAGHEIDGYEEIYFDDKLLATVTNGTTVGAINAPYTDKVSIELFDGSQTTACASMVAASAGGWTEDHKLLGLAYSHVVLTYDEGTFPAGLPTVKAVIRGKKVLDTRTGLIAWSDNPAMCIRDYMLTDIDHGGMGCGVDESGEAWLITAANICDESVESMIALDVDNIPVTPGVKALYKPVVGSSEKRYTLNGQIVLDGVPTDIIKSMLTAMAGEAIYSEGMWKIFAGAPMASVATIDESWLNGGISFQTGTNKNNKNNTVKGTFTNSNDYWADTEFPEVPAGISTPPNAAYWLLTASPDKYNAASTYPQNSYVTWAGKVYQAYSSTTVPVSTPPPNSSYWVLVELHDNSVQYPINHIAQRNGAVYISTGIVPVSNPYLAEDGGEVLAANIVLPFTTGSSEAQRLAIIALRKSRLGFSLDYPCNHKAFKLEAMDVISLENDLMGIATDFRVINWEFSMMGGTNIALIEYDPEMYNVTPGDIVPLVSNIITNLPNPWLALPPANVSGNVSNYSGSMASNVKTKTVLTWEETQAGSRYQIMLDGVIIQTVTDTTYTVADLTVGSHDIAVRAINGVGAVSAWQHVTSSVDAVTDPTLTLKLLNPDISEDKLAQYLLKNISLADLTETVNHAVQPGAFEEGAAATLPDILYANAKQIVMIAGEVGKQSSQIELLNDRISLKLNNNGHVAGMAIGWREEDDKSEVVFLTDALKIYIEGQAVPIFSTGMVGGVNTVGINGNLIIDGTVVAGSVDAEDITGTVITGKTLQTAATGQRFVVSQETNEGQFYGDQGDGTISLLASIGISPSGSTDYPDDVIGLFGSIYSAHTAIQAASSNVAVTAWGTIGVVSSGTDYGIKVPYTGKRTAGTHRKGFTGLAPLLLTPFWESGAPTHEAGWGAIWLDADCIMYVQKTDPSGTNWQKVGAQ